MCVNCINEKVCETLHVAQNEKGNERVQGAQTKNGWWSKSL